MKKQIPDFPDYYAHSDGYIVSHKFGKEKVLSGGLSGGKRKDKKGGVYKSVTLRENGKQVNRLVHILVAKAFIENPKNLPQVNHKDGNKKNNNISNLEWSTASENQKHAVKMGLWKRPTDEHFKIMKLNMAKTKSLFTLEEGSEIVEMKCALGLSSREMAKLVGCSASTIKTWLAVKWSILRMGL
jgi:DNA-binding transcriptional regulator YiaG